MFGPNTTSAFDVVGMILAGLGIGGMAFGLSVLGLNFLPWFVVVALVFGGACFIAAYLAHARHTENPALDLTLFRLPTFFASVVGGFIFRLGLGALPFLLPLMLQIGFGMTPFQSGMITFATALGAMGMKWAVAFILHRFGFRNILVVNSVISSAFLAICAAFTATTPIALMLILLFVGGFFRSLQFTSINTIAYADIDPQRVGRATALVSVAQQLCGVIRCRSWGPDGGIDRSLQRRRTIAGRRFPAGISGGRGDFGSFGADLCPTGTGRRRRNG